MIRALALGSLVAAAVSALVLTTQLSSHEDARGRWDEARARLGESDYSADASDALYLEVDHLRSDVRHATGALAFFLVAAGWSVAAWRRRPDGPRTAPTRSELLGASAIDAAVVVVTAGAIGLARGVTLSSPAPDDTLATLVPALALTKLVAIAALGHTPGTLLLRLSPGWPASRAPLAALALPLALLAPLGLAGKTTKRCAPHLAALGVA